MCISFTSDIDQLVKPSKISKWPSRKRKHFVIDETNPLDLRYPGKWKQEFSTQNGAIIMWVVFRLIFKCNFIFSAGPKSYYCIDFDSEKYKRSSKGVQHRIKLNYEEYKDVVYKSRRLEVENVGIRLRKNQMSTILQNKTGMRNVFIKSYVENDAISVRPFNKFLE